jgi:signal transduction histidine kinase
VLARRRQYEVRDHLQKRKAAEDALQRAHDALESLVEQRTLALRRLSVKLLRVQDEERRRIARELHDSLGQDLTAAKISLDVLAQSLGGGSSYLRNAEQLVDRSISDTRTLSHLLHPPPLDEAGFASAAKWYVEGFGKRSGIATNLDLPEHVNRLPRRTETALFRILQEALTNVHRHSGSRAVEVRVTADESRVALTVKNFGMGVPREVLDRFWKTRNVGVGLAGIRERLKELGGSLKIESNRILMVPCCEPRFRLQRQTASCPTTAMPCFPLYTLRQCRRTRRSPPHRLLKNVDCSQEIPSASIGRRRIYNNDGEALPLVFLWLIPFI